MSVLVVCHTGEKSRQFAIASNGGSFGRAAAPFCLAGKLIPRIHVAVWYIHGPSTVYHVITLGSM